jgi:ATP-binding cassette subfamily B protein
MRNSLMSRLETVSGLKIRRHAKISPVAAFRRLWPMVRPYRFLLLGSAFFQAISVVCDTAAIQVFSYLTDEVLATGDVSAFWAPAALWLAVAVVGAGVTFLSYQLSARVGEAYRLRCRDELFRHAQRLPPDFYDNRQPGDLLTRLTSDVDESEHVVASGPIELLNTVVSIVLFAGAALYVRWELALLTFAAAPVFWLASRGLSTRIRVIARAERDSNGALVNALDESIANMPLVQAYNRQYTEWEKVHREGDTWMRISLARTRLANAYAPLANVIESVSVLAVVGVGAWEIAAGRLSLGGLLAFAAYLGYLYPQIQALGGLAVSLSSATAAGERIFEVLGARPAVQDGETGPEAGTSTSTGAGTRAKAAAGAGLGSLPGSRRGRRSKTAPVPKPAPTLAPQPAAWQHPAAPTTTSRGIVTFDDVSFGYPGADRRALDALHFTAHPGQLVLIAGPSGAGKSTLAKLLLRFYDPVAGRILLDGQDIARMPLRQLREHVTLMPQEPMVFDATIRENIAYGRPGATDDEILRAAYTADMDGFVAELPDGYDTVVGPRGRLLSGGQRQRMSIARALVRDTPVLVLDEPTTGLDPESARRVMDPLRRLMASRTTFLITHDPWLAAQADTVLQVTPGMPNPMPDPMPPMPDPMTNPMTNPGFGPMVAEPPFTDPYLETASAAPAGAPMGSVHSFW